ncbi:glycosyltransferase family 4 protein [Aliarcobacter cryaerophilus]|uniref:glycosyltransferase family 4 protein n=1 Tax=Aliarcobacter cryaerophilus TaxID=28198 RepID=UPI0008248C89|nr:glycosyltransferase family 4 protein [Aliarcobacter cryaerophilus]
MNILCISKYASPPNYSKVPARLFVLAKEFINLGHKTTLITSDSNHFAKFPNTDKIHNFENIDSVPLCWIKTKKYTKTASIARILSWFDFERKLFKLDLKRIDKPDVVIVSSLSIFSIIYGYYLKKKLNSFLIFEIRDIWPLTMTEEGGFSKWHPLVLLVGFIEKFGYKKADLVVGTMPKLDLHIKNILGYEKPFFCSPLGFKPNNYKDKFLKEENPFDSIFPKDKIVVGYAGSMGITNALDTFIDTIKLLKDNQNIHFMLVGSGDLRANFEKDLENCNNVTFLPRIAQDEVKYFLQKCDILYLSTKDSKVWEYGQSMNKVVEYMLASKPIIASYTGYPSMINEANCGYFENTISANDLKEKILSIANLNENERKNLGTNGKEWIFNNRQYSKLAKEYIDKIIELRKRDAQINI